jgi:hypothetical protein
VGLNKRMINDINEKIERFKIKAETLLKEDKRAFIVDYLNRWFFCDLVLIGDTRLTFIPFKGNKSGEKVVLFWADVINLEEYREERE